MPTPKPSVNPNARKGLVVLGTDIDIPSEAIVHLPEKKSIYRIVIHSTNLEEFEVHAFNSRGEWDKIYDQRSNKNPIIEIRFNKVVMTLQVLKWSCVGRQRMPLVDERMSR